MDNHLTQICIFVATALSSIAALITLIVNMVKSRRIAQHKVYQRLEFASIDLFRFEMVNSDKIWRLYNPDFDVTIVEKQTKREIANYVTQLLNLFEMSIELHHSKIVDHKIFCTWLKWIYDTSSYKNFQYLWEKDLKNHYTNYLGELIDFSIETINKGGNFDTFTKSLCERKTICKGRRLCIKKFCRLEKYLKVCNKTIANEKHKL